MLFSIIFTLTFAFIVGLTTANFGALVRYKIPLLIFFVPFLIFSILNIKKITKKE